MKTIEEAASYHVDNLPNNPSFWDSFMAGVEFAQRWIPVSEELPVFGEVILFKPEESIVNVGFWWHDNLFWTINALNHYPSSTVTHWRPIEVK